MQLRIPVKIAEKVNIDPGSTVSVILAQVIIIRDRDVPDPLEAILLNAPQLATNPHTEIPNHNGLRPPRVDNISGNPEQRQRKRAELADRGCPPCIREHKGQELRFLRGTAARREWAVRIRGPSRP